MTKEGFARTLKSDQATDLGGYDSLQIPLPFRCPVCEGRTTMPKGFYTRILISSDMNDVPCKTCGQTGVIWS